MSLNGDFEQEIRQALQTRYEDLIDEIERIIWQQKRSSTIWNTLHISLSVIAITSSCASAIFTFADTLGQMQLFSLTFSAFTSASLVTFFNASAKAAKTRQSELSLYSISQELKNTLASIKTTNEEDLISKLASIQHRLQLILQSSE